MISLTRLSDSKSRLMASLYDTPASCHFRSVTRSQAVCAMLSLPLTSQPMATLHVGAIVLRQVNGVPVKITSCFVKRK